MTQLAMKRSVQPANQRHANTHYQQPIAMQNMWSLLHRPHHLIEAPPTHWPCFVPPPPMRVIFVRTKGRTVSKHNSHGAIYYRSLARTLGGEPVIVGHGENSHKERKLGRNGPGRLMVFWFKMEELPHKNKDLLSKTQERVKPKPHLNPCSTPQYILKSELLFWISVFFVVVFLDKLFIHIKPPLRKRVTTEAQQWTENHI